MTDSLLSFVISKYNIRESRSSVELTKSHPFSHRSEGWTEVTEEADNHLSQGPTDFWRVSEMAEPTTVQDQKLIHKSQ